MPPGVRITSRWKTRTRTPGSTAAHTLTELVDSTPCAAPMTPDALQPMTVRARSTLAARCNAASTCSGSDPQTKTHARSGLRPPRGARAAIAAASAALTRSASTARPSPKRAIGPSCRLSGAMSCRLKRHSGVFAGSGAAGASVVDFDAIDRHPEEPGQRILLVRDLSFHDVLATGQWSAVPQHRVLDATGRVLVDERSAAAVDREPDHAVVGFAVAEEPGARPNEPHPHAVARRDRVGVSRGRGDVAVSVQPFAAVVELEQTVAGHAVLNDVRAVQHLGSERVALVNR